MSSSPLGYDFVTSLFSTKGTQSLLFLPTRDALYKHLLLENYQARIWRNALEGIAEIPTSHRHGWLLKDEALTIDWMDELTALFAVLQLMSCHCTNVKETGSLVEEINFHATAVMTVKISQGKMKNFAK